MAESTKATYRSHLRKYLEYCSKIKCQPVPISNINLCRYVAYLGRSYRFCTVQQYLNIVRILHLELGLSNPLKQNWQLSSVLSGIKRGKGVAQSYKLPIHISMLRQFHSMLNHADPQDARFWAAVLACFFGLLRIGNITVKNKKSWCPDKVIKRSDFSVCTKGSVLSVSCTKTIQYKERVLEVPLPFIHNECICPTSAMIRFLHMSRDVPNNMPLLSILQSGKIIPLTQDMVRKKLSQLLPDKRYGTHSLRRGGATWLLVSGVSLDMVKSLGDWKSDAVLKYIKPSNAAKFDSIQLALSKLS